MSKGRMFADNEIDIIEQLQNLNNSEICFPIESEKAVSVLNKIKAKKNWAKWVDNSKNTNNPPDFYCDNFKLMMDIMRVNDAERFNRRGKFYNPSMRHERDIYNEIERSGLLAAAPNAKVTINGNTGLPTEEDHNFALYSNNYKRVISEHIDSISSYKQNHPGYEIIFVVFDESTAYFEKRNQTDDTSIVEQSVLGRPHLFFIDEELLKCFYDKGIDYLLWLTPYKLLKTSQGFFPLPQLTVYDLHKPRPSTINYDLNKMRSSEL